MSISQAIEELERLKEIYGDIEFCVRIKYRNEEIYDVPVFEYQPYAKTYYAGCLMNPVLYVDVE